MKIKTVKKTVIYVFAAAALGVSAYAAPLGEALRTNKQAADTTAQQTAEQPAPPIGEALRQKRDRMPEAPASQEFSITRKQFAEAHWHGLEIVPITDQDRRQFLIPFEVKGVMVDEVTLEAADCGFLAADVILSVDGYPVADLKEFLIASMRVRDRREAEFKVWRQGDSISLTLKAAPYYDNLGFANMEGGEGGIPGESLTPFDTEMFISVPPTKLSPQELQKLSQIDAQTGATSAPGGAAAPPPGGQQQAVSRGSLTAQAPPDALTTASPSAPSGQAAAAQTFQPEQAQTVSRAADSNPNLAWLGVHVVSVSDVVARDPEAGPAEGAYVTKVEAASPASKIGLKREDIITSVGRIQVKDASHLKEIIRPLKPGDDIEFTVMRKGREYTVNCSLGASPSAAGRLGGRQANLNMLMVVGVFLLVYILVIENIFSRIITFPLGAIVLLAIGRKYGFYNFNQALSSINVYVLMFIAGMNFLTSVLNDAGFFDYISKVIIIKTRGHRTKIFLFFCLFTFTVSAFMDNIATILVMVPLTLIMAKEMHFDPKQLIIGIIISSNLGGGATMIGDFPNLLISLSTPLQFHDFLIYLMPVTIVLLAAMFIYMRFTQKDFFKGPKYSLKDIDRSFYFVRTSKNLKKTIKNRKDIVKCLSILGLIILGMAFSKPLGVNPALFPFFGGISALMISSVPRKRTLRHGGWPDIIFFAALFVMVGAAAEAGILRLMSEIITTVSSGHLIITSLLLMWTAAFFTVFMNAGPTAAIFIPVILKFGISDPQFITMWALSLGIMAGASASLYGASGGPLASSLINKYTKANKKNFHPEAPVKDLKKNFSFKEYFKTGGPIMGIFLIISSIYIVLLAYLGV